MSDKSEKFSLFRKKEDEDLKKAEDRIEELEDKLSQKAREEAREKTEAEIRTRHEEMMEAAKQKREMQVKKHTVASGETLSGIAKKYYDDAGKYMKIYEANKDLIGNDPSLIQPGMELVIPEL